MTKRAAFRNFIVLLLLACPAITAWAQTPEAAKPSQQPAVPNIILKSLDGKEWRLDSNRGRIVLLNFWATWCEPCRTETPMLVKVAEEYKERGVAVAGIALDQDGSDQVIKFAADYRVSYPILLPEAGSPWFALSSLPMSILIGKDGRMAAKYIGAVPEKTLRADLERLLKAEEEPISSSSR